MVAFPAIDVCLHDSRLHVSKCASSRCAGDSAGRSRHSDGVDGDPAVVWFACQPNQRLDRHGHCSHQFCHGDCAAQLGRGVTAVTG